MKKYFLFALIAIFYLPDICHAQAYKYVYYFDDQLTITNASKAIILGKGLYEDGGLYRLDYFVKKTGNLLMSAHYADSSLNMMQGKFTVFYLNSKIENEGDYLNDQKNGLWQKWDTLGLKIDSTVYQNGQAFTTATFNYHENRRLNYYTFKDSLADILKTISYTDKGELSSEVFFKGQNGFRKTYDSGRVRLDSFYTRQEKEADFTGGTNAWRMYLQKNLDAMIPVNNKAPKGAYQVIVRFIVAKDGSISNVLAETNHGYGMEKEVIRIIKKAPAWEPAVQYGRKVNAYRRQPVTFVVEEQ